jgi:hypothetical protein
MSFFYLEADVTGANAVLSEGMIAFALLLFINRHKMIFNEVIRAD